MEQLTLPNFKSLQRLLSKTTLKMHASEVQGVMTGILCGNLPAPFAWEDVVMGGKVDAKTHAGLQALYEVSAKQLEEFLLEFQLVLPPDTVPLPERAEALTLWCQGYLTGLKLAMVPITGREPGEMTEAIDDIVEIAKMNYEEVVASEEDETAYVELVEYVRMAVILIYQDLRETSAPKKAAALPSKHLH